MQCAETVADNLRRYFPDRRRILLIGVLRDKDVDGMLAVLAPAADAFVCVTPDSPRAMSAEELAERLRPFGKPVAVCAGIPEGVSRAREEAGDEAMVCAVGSLYMAGEVRYCMGMY